MEAFYGIALVELFCGRDLGMEVRVFYLLTEYLCRAFLMASENISSRRSGVVCPATKFKIPVIFKIVLLKEN